MNGSRLMALAAIAMLLAGLGYVIVELVVASAWTDPPYDWAYNLVPDLGNSACGPYQDLVVCSPLYSVMNTMFVVHGILFGLAGILLSRPLVGKPRAAMLVLTPTYAVGLSMTGIFHQFAGVPVGTLVLNFTGAGLGILAGNLIVVVAGTQWRRLLLPAWFGRTSVVLCSVAIVAAVLLFAVGDLVPPGIRERASIYPFIAWQIVTGPILLKKGIGMTSRKESA